MLGTGGGPRPRKVSSGSAQVVVSNGAAYVVACGDGVARQLVIANASLTSLASIFITHHHSDHNADYGNLILLAWTAGLNKRIDAWGPPRLARMTELFFEMNEYDDAKDRSIVISGDTTPTKSLIDLARGADVLVHDALFPAGVDRIAARVPNAQVIRKSILSHHTTAEDAGRVASQAGVKTLVLSHLVPPDDPQISEAMWKDAAARQFNGTIIVAKDLLEI